MPSAPKKPSLTLWTTLSETSLGHTLCAVSEDDVTGEALVWWVGFGDTARMVREGFSMAQNGYPCLDGQDYPSADRVSGLLKRLPEDVDHYASGRLQQLEWPLNTQGTPFQKQVWKALQGIPRGKTLSYRELAESLGKPTAARAVASACAANRIALAIPCHRVIQSTGSEGSYRWGVVRKKQLLTLEARSG